MPARLQRLVSWLMARVGAARPAEPPGPTVASLVGSATAGPLANWLLERVQNVTTLATNQRIAHATGIGRANSILRSGCIGGVHTKANFSVDHFQMRQAEEKEVVMVFDWNGPVAIGNAYAPAGTELYHHHGTSGYVESWISHGTSQQDLRLVAIGFWESDFATCQVTPLIHPMAVRLARAP